MITQDFRLMSPIKAIVTIFQYVIVKKMTSFVLKEDYCEPIRVELRLRATCQEMSSSILPEITVL